MEDAKVTDDSARQNVDKDGEDRRQVINEFCYLLEKSKQLFNGIR